MSYTAADSMPSIFLLRESKRQSILTVFNWTEKQRDHKFALAGDLGLPVQGHNQVFDIFDSKQIGSNLDAVEMTIPPHSATVMKIIDTSISAASPAVAVKAPDEIQTGAAAQFSAEADPAGVPVIAYHWDFGDGTTSLEPTTVHTYTHEGHFTIQLRADGLDGIPFVKSSQIEVSGKIDSRFTPASKKRLVERQ
jgi:alpha-galactosidase